MPQHLEIEGNLVRIVERQVVNEMALADMLEHLERRPPVKLPALPRNRTIGVYWDESEAPNKVFNLAITLPPSVRLLPLRRDYLIKDLPPRLAMPWTVMVFQMRTRVDDPRGRDWSMDTVTHWFSKDEPKGTQADNLIIALLPNVYANGAICWGNTGVNADQPLMDRIDETVNQFFQTEFNHAGDFAHSWPHYKDNYRKWAQETATLGAGSFRNWPDWDDPRRTHKTLHEVLELSPDVRTPIVLPDGIPNFQVNPTFGVAEAWAEEQLTNNQRLRLKTVLANLEAEKPALFTPQPPAAVLDLDEDDD